MLVLIVEDDPSLGEVIRLGLEAEGFRTESASRGDEALRVFEAAGPDLVLLDVMLPGMDGFEVCRTIRHVSLVPIIMLTARTSTVDVVVGLESGADDYLTKPFQFPELIARIRAVVRRSQAAQSRATEEASGSGASVSGTEVLELGSLVLYPAAYSVSRNGVDLRLTATEFRLLLELVRHRGQVLSRDQLLELVWGYTYLGDSRLVDVHIQRLRAKVEDDPADPVLIQTVRGVGYKAAR
jgi:two-component system response regulator MtrA